MDESGKSKLFTRNFNSSFITNNLFIIHEQEILGKNCTRLCRRNF